MNRQKISIAMCTYNGEAFLAEQLESILAQSRPASEIVICDDGSTDGTWMMLESYRRRFPELINLYRNDKNLKPAKNFEKAISLCKNPLIVLSDQDDVWYQNKLDKLAQRFEDLPDLALVFSNADLIDAEGNILDGDLWHSVGFDKRMKAAVKSGRAFEVLLRKSFVTGCTMMFRETLKSTCLPIEGPCLHDYWISLIAAASSRIDFVSERLISYRQHASNVIGVRRVSLRERLDVAHRRGTLEFSQDIVGAEKLLKRLGDVERARSSLVQRKIDFLTSRVKLWSDKTPWMEKASLLIRNWSRGEYRQWSSGWPALIKDLAQLFGIIKVVARRNQ